MSEQSSSLGHWTASRVFVRQSFHTVNRLQTSPAHPGQPTVETTCMHRTMESPIAIVIIDAYSRFPEGEIVHSTSAKAIIIPKMDRIFATHGIPDTIRSDNGPPHTSNEIRDYMRENGINHKKITPLRPQANSEVENFMKPLTKAVRSANVEGRQWKKDLYRFLLNYSYRMAQVTQHRHPKYSKSVG